MPSAGGLFELERNGTRVPAIAHVGKSAYFYVLDRATGEPLHRSRGDAGAARRRADRVVLADATDSGSPAAARARELQRSGSRDGPRTRRPSTRRRAATSWSAAAASTTPGRSRRSCTKRRTRRRSRRFNFRAARAASTGAASPSIRRAGFVFATSHDGALVGWVQDKDPNVTYSFEAVGSKQPYDRASINGVGPFFTFSAPIGGEYDANGQAVGPSAPCQRPPWGKLVAVNANTGEIAWESVLGLNEALPEGKQLVGNAGSAGPTVTAGGVVFVGATSDRRFRAFDARTRQRALERDAREQRQREPDELRGTQRQATRRHRRRRHRQRVRAAVSRCDGEETFTYHSRGTISQNDNQGILHAAL